jgi:hypothetical protein
MTGVAALHDADLSASADGGASSAGAPASEIGVRRNAGDVVRVAPAADGTFVIEVGQTERIDVALPAHESGYAGYQVVKGERQPLPRGSTLDGNAGTFAWQPVAGFLGRYDLVFAPQSVSAAESGVRVAVVVGPPMRMALEAPVSGNHGQPLTVSGWALDLASRGGSGVDAIHVWAFPVSGGQPIFLGVADQSGKRPDVARTYGAPFEDSGFSLQVRSLVPGTYDIVVYVHRAANGKFEAEQGTRVTVW